MTPANGKTRGTTQPQTIIGRADFDTRPTRNTCAIFVAFMTPEKGKTIGMTQPQTIGKADLDTSPTRDTCVYGIVVVVFITHTNASTNWEVGTTASLL